MVWNILGTVPWLWVKEESAGQHNECSDLEKRVICSIR